MPVPPTISVRNYIKVDNAQDRHTQYSKFPYTNHRVPKNIMLQINQRTDGISFKVFVQPRSSKNTIAGLHGNALKIRLTAPPVDNAANRLCIKYLAKYLKTSKSTLEILSGHTSRNKLLLFKYQTEKPDKAVICRMKKKIESLIK